AALAVAGAQTTLSPFVTLPSTGSPSPMAGLALTVTGGPLALRAGGHMSMQNRVVNTGSTTVTRPWGADVDALAYLEGLNYGDLITFSPYVFAGVGTAAMDSGSL